MLRWLVLVVVTGAATKEVSDTSGPEVRKSFKTQIRLDGKQLFLGRYATQAEAEQRYKTALNLELAYGNTFSLARREMVSLRFGRDHN